MNVKITVGMHQTHILEFTSLDPDQELAVQTGFLSHFNGISGLYLKISYAVSSLFIILNYRTVSHLMLHKKLIH